MGKGLVYVYDPSKEQCYEDEFAAMIETRTDSRTPFEAEDWDEKYKYVVSSVVLSMLLLGSDSTLSREENKLTSK